MKHERPQMDHFISRMKDRYDIDLTVDECIQMIIYLTKAEAETWRELRDESNRALRIKKGGF